MAPISALDCCWILRDDLPSNCLHQIAPAFQAELFRHDAQGAVGGDEVYGFYALVTFYRQQEMFEKDEPLAPVVAIG